MVKILRQPGAAAKGLHTTEIGWSSFNSERVAKKIQKEKRASLTLFLVHSAIYASKACSRL